MSLVGGALLGSVTPRITPNGALSVSSMLGVRPTQEDRVVVCPQLGGALDALFVGVFDGTVGDEAASFAQSRMPEAVVNSPAFARARAMCGTTPPSSLPPAAQAEFASLLRVALQGSFSSTDSALLTLFTQTSTHYCSSTAVAVLLWGSLLTVGHLGDSRAVLGRSVAGGVLAGLCLTRDHKPNDAGETARIVHAGGSLVYLHGGRPFLRGGDFAARLAMGHRPMQLNYSRALGGKDLKPYGLSATPDVAQLALTPADRLLLVATDGVWDVVTPDQAVRIAWAAHRAGLDPSAALTKHALAEHLARGSADNVTAACLILPTLAAAR